MRGTYAVCCAVWPEAFGFFICQPLSGPARVRNKRQSPALSPFHDAQLRDPPSAEQFIEPASWGSHGQPSQHG